jgi:hypothetical protein
MNDEKSKTKSDQALQALRTWVHAGRGRLAVVLNLLEARTGKQFHRNNVSRWLHPNEADREQPRLGVGLVLIEIQAELCGAAPAKPKEANGRSPVGGALGRHGGVVRKQVRAADVRRLGKPVRPHRPAVRGAKNLRRGKQ